MAQHILKNSWIIILTFVFVAFNLSSHIETRDEGGVESVTIFPDYYFWNPLSFTIIEQLSKVFNGFCPILSVKCLIICLCYAYFVSILLINLLAILICMAHYLHLCSCLPHFFRRF